MHSPGRREDQHEPKPAQFRHPSLDYEDPPYLFAYPRQPAFLPAFPITSNSMSVPPTSAPYAYLPPPVPPVIGPIQVQGGTWWYVPAQSQQQPYTILAPPVQPFPSQSPPSSWTTQQQPSPPPSSPPPSSSSSFSHFSHGVMKPLTRRTYPQNPPAARSGWVMWVGNVPDSAKHDELWSFFTQQPYDRSPGGEDKNRNRGGVLSIFLVSRSRCAFVNYETEDALQAAIKRFDGVPMYAADLHAAPLVCRVRAYHDNLCMGVGRQQGRGLHVEWVKNQAQAQSPGTLLSDRLNTEQPSLHASDSSTSSNASTPSNASTSSSFLEIHFPQRFFILKSFTQANINTSVSSGLWATQRHNEAVLDQAFRTAKDIFLIFSVNKSGSFCGFARMQGTTGNGGPGGCSVTSDSPALKNHSSMVPVASPEPLHPNKTHTSLLDTSDSIDKSQTTAPQLGQLHHGRDISSVTSNTHLMDKVPLDKITKDSDTGREGWGHHFKLQWLSTVHIPFQQTHHIRNLWNGNREVKISRDGTEVEPRAGWALLGAWK